MSAKRSLRTKFLLWLSVSALAMTLLGAYATYHIASQQLQVQLLQRARLLASAVNHSAMVASTAAELAHVAGEVMHDNPEVTALVILSRDRERPIFERYSNPDTLSTELSDHLKAEARHALNTRTFGLHPLEDDHLSIVVPLTTPIGSHDRTRGTQTEEGHSNRDDVTAANSSRETANKESGHLQNHEHVASGMSQHRDMTLPEPAGHTHAQSDPSPMRPANESMSMGTFGAVLMSFDRKSVSRGLKAILWRLMPTSLVGITMTLILCYLLLHHQVLKPIGGIRTAMIRQQTGERDARAEPQSSLEIDEVASTLNRMLDSLKEREDLIREMALTDPLTGLANRKLFKMKLREAFANASRASDKVALLFVDLDRFKLINDTLGHPAGDALLIEVARRLEMETREVDTVARLGGDEFAVIATGWKEPDLLSRLALRIIAGISSAAVAAGLEQSTGASIGIAIYPNDADNPNELIRRADLALYQAKDAGRGVYHVYDDSLHAKTVELHRLEQDLRRALDEGQLSLHYQPQIDIKTGKVKTVEALVRWLHPERGLLSPAEFIPAAEASNQIVELGNWVLSTACRRNRAWQEAGMTPFCVAVNISAREIQMDSFSERVGEILASSGLDPQWLELEVTETTAMLDLEKVRANFHKLMELGVDIAIDDFGTGHSSLTNLRRLPFGKLKIDQSFIREIIEDLDVRSITEAVIDIGSNLGLTVIAEGVETQAQLRLLERLGCDRAQGFGIAEPMTADALTAWMAERRPESSATSSDNALRPRTAHRRTLSV